MFYAWIRWSPTPPLRSTTRRLGNRHLAIGGDYLRAQIRAPIRFARRAVCTCETDSREAGTMRKLIFGMNLTLDGYIAAAGDDIGWSGPPSDELFQFWLDHEQASGLSLYG